MVKTNKRILTSPAVPLGKECRLLSRTAGGKHTLVCQKTKTENAVVVNRRQFEANSAMNVKEHAQNGE